MRTNHTSVRAAISATVVAAALPALLVLGAGSAQAGPVGAGDFKDPHALQIAWLPWTGGLTAYIKNNRSHDAGWCVYTADWYTSPPFYLAANATHELVMFPSYPENRDWNVNVDCSDGQFRHDQVYHY
ncbi:hypothetical protein [Mycolicibacterium phlei]|jgi:hypothetical protein